MSDGPFTSLAAADAEIERLRGQLQALVEHGLKVQADCNANATAALFAQEECARLREALAQCSTYGCSDERCTDARCRGGNIARAALAPEIEWKNGRPMTGLYAAADAMMTGAVVHVLWHGTTLCGVRWLLRAGDAGIGAEDRWVGFDQSSLATCEVCKTNMPPEWK